MGKSWLAYGLRIAVATGGVALGTRPVEKGEALYLALEDNERRLQRRLKILLAGDSVPEGLHLATEWPGWDAGGVEALDAWLRNHPDARLAAIDTLKRVRPRASGNRSMYDVDYEALAPLVPVAARHNVAILVVHHNNQMVNPEDTFDAISGSTGLTGAVDGMLVMKRERGSADAILYVDGRDIEESEALALAWDPALASWSLKGDAEEYRMSPERRRASHQGRRWVYAPEGCCQGARQDPGTRRGRRIRPTQKNPNAAHLRPELVSSQAVSSTSKRSTPLALNAATKEPSARRRSSRSASRSR